jgi:hypothetical protein
VTYNLVVRIGVGTTSEGDEVLHHPLSDVMKSAGAAIREGERV